MLTTAGVRPDEPVQGLESRMRCRECDEKGRAVISIRASTGLKVAWGVNPSRG